MSAIVGTWRLVRGRATAEDGTPMPPPFGEKAMGRLTLNSDGRMMAVLCDGRPTLPAGEARQYSSYCGNYTFDGTRLVTRVDACADPDRMGTDQVRQVRFEGPLLVLQPPPRMEGGRLVSRELWWERISDA
jgi:hypothetical protein